MLTQLSLPVITGSAGSQRWKERRSRFTPKGTLFNPARCEIVPIPEGMAKEFITQHHYSGSYPAARFRVGLMLKPGSFQPSFLAGCAVLSVPMQSAVVPKYLGVEANEGVELGRLVLLDHDALGFNAESYFVARAFKLLREALPNLKGVVSYADPLPRFAADGELVKPGHAGTIYKALNGRYHGRSGKRTLIISRSGQVVSERALSKIRNEEQGMDYACRQLLAMGAPSRIAHELARDYVNRALIEGGFQKAQHPGNHVFSWSW